MKKIRNTIRDHKAITLIALVITIIILLILAGITVAGITNNGLFEKAKYAKLKSLETEAEEDINLIIIQVRQENRGQATLSQIVKKIEEVPDSSYIVTSNSQIASLSNKSNLNSSMINDETEAIYVTNEKYGVEIRVTKDLTVASTGSLEKSVINNPRGQVMVDEDEYTQLKQTVQNLSSELNAYKSKMSSAITIQTPSALNLTTSDQKITFAQIVQQAGTGLTIDNGGVKVGAGITKVEVSGAVKAAGLTSGDGIYTSVFRNNTMIGGYSMSNSVNTIATTIYTPTIYSVSEGDTLYLYARNGAAARGSIDQGGLFQTRFTVRVIQ